MFNIILVKNKCFGLKVLTIMPIDSLMRSIFLLLFQIFIWSTQAEKLEP